MSGGKHMGLSVLKSTKALVVSWKRHIFACRFLNVYDYGSKH